jgi:hypothetical protein
MTVLEPRPRDLDIGFSLHDRNVRTAG